MRIKIQLETDWLPIMYRHLFVALIRQAWSDAGHDTDPPCYTFNVALPPGYITKKRVVQFGDRFIEDIAFEITNGKPLSLFMSTASNQLVEAVLAIPKNEPIDAGDGVRLVHVGSHRLAERLITGSRALFKICSPVCLTDTDGDPTLDGEEKDLWSAAIARIQQEVARAATGHSLAGEIRVTPLDVKRKVVKHAIGRLKSNPGGFGYVSSFTGTIAIDGLPEDLNTIYITGLGTRTEEGFGMLDLVRESTSKE